MTKRVSDIDGGMTILGLGMLMLVIPLIIMVMQVSQVANVSSTGQGMAYSIAYGSLGRALDPEATVELSTVAPYGVSPQLDWQGSSSPSAYSDAQTVLNVTAGVIGRAGVHAVYEFEPIPDEAPHRPPGKTLGSDTPISLVNVAHAPEYNRAEAATGASCSTGGPATLVSADCTRILAWTDIRARDADGRFTTLHPSQPGAHVWTHYTSGAQVKLGFRFSAGSLAGSFAGEHRGVASFGRPCQIGATDCDQ